MATERYVVLGLAQARASWFGDVARWATTAAVLIMAFIGALMWGAYEAIWDTAKQNTEDKVNEIGT